MPIVISVCLPDKVADALFGKVQISWRDGFSCDGNSAGEPMTLRMNSLSNCDDSSEIQHAARVKGQDIWVTTTSGHSYPTYLSLAGHSGITVLVRELLCSARRQQVPSTAPNSPSGVAMVSLGRFAD